MQQIKDRMLKYGADAALMSGSGPTVFALCEKKTRAQRMSGNRDTFQRIADRLGHPSIITIFNSYS